MNKAWFAIIPGIMLLIGGLAVVAMTHTAHAGESSYCGIWRCIDGSGEIVQLTKNDKDFQLRIRDAVGSILVTCSGGNLKNGQLLFTDSASSGDSGYLTVKLSNNRISIEGFGSIPKEYQRR